MTMKKTKTPPQSQDLADFLPQMDAEREREREKRKYRKITEKLTEFFSDVRFQKLSINF